MNIIKRADTLTETPLNLTKFDKDYNMGRFFFKNHDFDCDVMPVTINSNGKKKHELLVSRNANYFDESGNGYDFNLIIEDCVSNKPVQIYKEEEVDKYLRLLINCQDPLEESPENEDIDLMIKNILEEIDNRSLFIGKVISKRLNLFASLKGTFEKSDLDILDNCNKKLLNCFANVKLSDGENIDI
jgi:hypothetical protein